jgi:hypothetical protein
MIYHALILRIIVLRTSSISFPLLNNTRTSRNKFQPTFPLMIYSALINSIIPTYWILSHSPAIRLECAARPYLPIPSNTDGRKPDSSNIDDHRRNIVHHDRALFADPPIPRLFRQVLRGLLGVSGVVFGDLAIVNLEESPDVWLFALCWRRCIWRACKTNLNYPKCIYLNLEIVGLLCRSDSASG